MTRNDLASLVVGQTIINKRTLAPLVVVGGYDGSCLVVKTSDGDVRVIMACQCAKYEVRKIIS